MSATIHRGFAGCTRALAQIGGCWRCKRRSAASRSGTFPTGRPLGPGTRNVSPKPPAATRGAIRVPMPRAQDTHAYYRLYAYVRPEGLNVGWDRDRIVAEVTARGIPLFQGSCSEVYLEKAFSGTDLVPPERLPVARELGETSLMFLTHPTLTDSDLNRVCATLDEVMRDAAR